MAWVCVGFSGEELIFVNKPHRRISKNVFYFDENDIFEHEWIDDKYCGCINPSQRQHQEDHRKRIILGG